MTTIRPFVCAAALGVASLALAAPGAAQSKPTCATGDHVVWENPFEKTFYRAGDSFYGKTAHGQYACESSAVKHGYRHIPLPGTSSMKSSGGTSSSKPSGTTPAPGAT